MLTNTRRVLRLSATINYKRYCDSLLAILKQNATAYAYKRQAYGRDTPGVRQGGSPAKCRRGNILYANHCCTACNTVECERKELVCGSSSYSVIVLIYYFSFEVEIGSLDFGMAVVLFVYTLGLLSCQRQKYSCILLDCEVIRSKKIKLYFIYKKKTCQNGSCR